MDRLSQYLRAIVRKAVSKLPYAGNYPYSVVSCNPLLQTVDARSLTTKMPDLTGVPMRSPGLFMMLPSGTQIQIGFRGMDPTAPYVNSYDVAGASKVQNEVFIGWLGLSQVNPPVSTLTVVFVPSYTLPAPQPEAPPLTPTPLTPSPVFFKLYGGAVTDQQLPPVP